MSRERPRPGHPDVLAFPELPVIEPEGDEDEDLLEPDEPPTVLITGASGNIGRKLREAWADRYDLILLDARDDGDEEVIAADLSTWDDDWVALFDEADAVVHLAADPREATPWPGLVGPNLDALANVFHATALSGVERLVFASSNHAMGGYRDRDETPIAPDLPPRPGNAYGAAKLMGERLGISLAQAFGLVFVALRIGWVLPGVNRPEDLPDEWARGLWLSNADLVRLFTCALEAPLAGGESAVVNGTSRNRGSRWSLEEAAGRLGYEPEDDAYRRGR
jgi:nucleoside-diphosphate-sugar epimerase